MNKETSETYLQIVPRSPILSSVAASKLLRVEQHHQPANGMSECCLPHYLLSIHLGQPIQLERIVEGRRSRVYLTQGDIMITPPDLLRKLSWNANAEFLLLRFEPQLFADTARDVELECFEIAPQLKIRDSLLQQIGLALKAELMINRLDRLYAESMANALAIHILRHYSTRKQVIRSYSGGLPNHKLQQAIDYIQAHLAEDISLKDIASELGMSQYHFARLFKQSIGYSPYQYLIKCRIEHAQQLLTQTQQIANVALQVGFASQSQFGRHFKRLTGVTPKQFLMK